MALLLVAVSGWAVVRWFRTAPVPVAGEDPVAMARFVSGWRFAWLPEQQKRAYGHALRIDMKAIRAAYDDGRLSRNELELASAHAWLARQLDRMDEYFALPTIRREQYLASRYRRKANAPPESDLERSSDTPDREQLLETRIRSWAPSDQAKWAEYRKAVAKVKEQLARG